MADRVPFVIKRDSNMEARIYRYSNSNRHFLRIYLASDANRPLLGILRHHVDLDFGRDFKRRVEAAGGALAEFQNENHGDQHDPSACAATAVELATEIMASVH